jgi:hypothetical protein
MSLWKIAYTGNLPGGDVFQHGIHLSTDDGVLISAVATQAVAAHTALLTTASGLQTLYRTDMQWAGVIVEEIAVADGSVIQTDVVTVSRAGTNANPMLPSECAICVTFRTATITRSGRGRWYLPAPSTNELTTTGRLISGALTALVTSHSAFFTALQATLPGGNAVVYSKHDAAAYPITSFDVGDVVDAQRRRRNKLVESRAGATVS